MRLIFDTNAWMTYFEGGEKAQRIRQLVEANQGHLSTTAANLYEIKYILLKAGRNAAEEAVAFIKTNSQIIPIDAHLAEQAAELRASHGLGAVDAFTLAAAQTLDSKIVSGDAHFARFKKHWMRI